jgi:Skp family chaperone for outer membrane proteins
MAKKTKQFIVAMTLAVAVLGVYQYGTLNAAAEAAPAKIGVVNVTNVLETCQKHKDWQNKMQAARTGMEKEFNAMRTELEALQANLKLMTPGTADYLKMQSDFLQKKAVMEAKDEFYRTKVEAEMQRWTEELYQKMLKVVEEVAKQKGLDMIIADELLDLPAPSLRDFMLTIKTKKMLYYKPNYDMTSAVLEALNKAD